MFGFGRKYPAYEYGADDDSIRRIDQAKLSKETAQGVFLAGSADNVGVIDLVKGAQGTIGSQMTPVKAGAMRCTGTFIPRFAPFNFCSHCQLKVQLICKGQ